jgi:hypothetical protein
MMTKRKRVARPLDPADTSDLMLFHSLLFVLEIPSFGSLADLTIERLASFVGQTQLVLTPVRD